MQDKSVKEKSVAKVTKRLIPFLLLMYVFAFLDRANVGFAKQAFQADTQLTDSMFAFGAGIFFLGYALFEIPSNLIMHRIGARIWMCRIMVTWGLVSSAMMFAKTETTFYILRFLLGVAEAGFFPGVILYLTYWYPSQVRGRALGLFYFGAPIALILGGPLSGLLLDLDGFAGIKGWQWMFLVEGILASVAGIWAFWYLDNKPADASWLNPQEKQILQDEIDSEEVIKHHKGPKSVLKSLADPNVLFFCLIYFFIQASLYGLVYYIPTQVANLSGKKVGLEVGLLTAIPWMCALLAVYWLPRLSNRLGGKRITASITLVMAAAGIAGSASTGNPVFAFTAICVAAAGIIGPQPIFWTFPTGYLAGVAAAGGIALINALGTLGGFVAPNARIWMEETYASKSAGLYLLSGSALLSAILILGIKKSINDGIENKRNK
ncbi:MAG: MFS transporter [Chitinophagaceae bacterium]